jgi:hypothetical protein
MDLENMTPEDFEALTDDQRQALLTEEQGEPAATDTPQEEAAEPAVPPVVPQGDITAQAPPSAEQVPAQPAAQMVPLGALHEERGKRQEAMTRLQQLEAILQDPNQLAQHLTQQGYQVAPAQQPDFYDDPNAAVSAQVQQIVAPLQQEIDYLRQEREAAARQRQVDHARQTFGDETDAYIQRFDASMPQFAGLDPALKAAAVHGMRWADPEYRKQQITAEAEALAKQLVEKALASNGKSSTPITLAGLAPAERDSDPADFSAIEPDRYERMSAAERAKVRQGMS